jgi:hypothetical protein
MRIVVFDPDNSDDVNRRDRMRPRWPTIAPGQSEGPQ